MFVCVYAPLHSDLHHTTPLFEQSFVPCFAGCYILIPFFSTAKGKLVRSILFPKPASFKVYADSFKFVGVMAVMATAG